MRTCQGCGTEYAERAPYCPRCGLGAGEILPALPEPQTFRAGRQTGNGDDAGEEMLDARRRGRYVPMLWIAAAVVVGGIALGIWLSGSSHPQQSSSALASIAAEHGGASLPVTIPPESTTPPAPGLIGVAPAVAHADGLPEVRSLLTAYFTAINAHNDYAGWAATLAKNRATPQAYAGYKTTHDSNISINALTPGPRGSWQASVSFTSHQAPTGNTGSCTSWAIRYSLVPEQGKLRIDTVGLSILNKLSC